MIDVLIVLFSKIFNPAVPPSIDSPNEVAGTTFTIGTSGFPWRTSKNDIRKFFKGVRIINGEHGIQMAKNGSMEASFMVTNEDEVRKALALNGQKFESRPIYGNAIQSAMNFKNIILIETFHIFQCTRSIQWKTMINNLRQQ